MPPDPADAAALYDMLRAGETTQRYLAGKSRADFDADEMLRDAVERKLEIIGEAVRRLTAALRDRNPQVPWQAIMATRHILAHQYDEVDDDIVWRIVTQHVPAMLPQVRALLPPPPPDPEPPASPGGASDS